MRRAMWRRQCVRTELAIVLFVSLAALGFGAGGAHAAPADCEDQLIVATVEDAAGKPIPQATVLSDSLTGLNQCPGVVRQETDTTGRASLRTRSQGMQYVQAMAFYEHNGAGEFGQASTDSMGPHSFGFTEPGQPLEIPMRFVLPVIEGPAVLRQGETATYRMVVGDTTSIGLEASQIAPNARWSEGMSADLPADLSASGPQTYDPSAAETLPAKIPPSIHNLFPDTQDGTLEVAGSGLQAKVTAVSPGWDVVSVVVDPSGMGPTLIGAMWVHVLPVRAKPVPTPTLKITGPANLKVGETGTYRAVYSHLTPRDFVWSVEPKGNAAIVRASGATVVVKAEKVGVIRVKVAENAISAELPIRAEQADPFGPVGVAILALSVLALIVALLAPGSLAAAGLAAATMGAGFALSVSLLVFGVSNRDPLLAAEGAVGLVLLGLGSAFRAFAGSGEAGEFAESILHGHEIVLDAAEEKDALGRFWDGLKRRLRRKGA